MPRLRKALIVTISSNSKKRGGRTGYDKDRSILEAAGEPASRYLLAGRDRVFELIKGGAKNRDGQRIVDTPRNGALVKGPDFGWSSQEARYLPAAERYRGNFFAQFSTDPEPLKSGSASVAILSGLYGVALADEPIQDYACHLNDNPTIRDVWTGLATDVILGLIERQGIERVIDFTALHSYRYLLEWGRFADVLPGGVLHLFGGRMTGDSLLIPLGALARHLLTGKSESELLRLESGQVLQAGKEDIYLHSEKGPRPDNLPTRLSDEVDLFDACEEVVRMARDVRRLLHYIQPDFDDKDTSKQIDDLVAERRVPKDVAEAMRDIVNWRDQIERHYSFTALQAPIDWLRRQYEMVKRWEDTES